MGQLRHPRSIDIKQQLLNSVGDGLTVSGGLVTVDEAFDFTFTSNIDFSNGLAVSSDGTKFFYGKNLVISTRYDSGKDSLVWEDETNTTDRMALDRTTGDLTIDGTLDETSSP